jgi:hypothetical protein
VSPKAGPDVFEEQKNLLPLPGIEPRIVQPIPGYMLFYPIFNAKTITDRKL